jgi:hypothetical protein
MPRPVELATSLNKNGACGSRFFVILDSVEETQRHRDAEDAERNNFYICGIELL